MADDKKIVTITGTVTRAYRPNKNEEKNVWRPANFYIETTQGSAIVKQFPLGYWDKDNKNIRKTYEPIQMPDWYEALDLDNLEGRQVEIKATASLNERSDPPTVEYSVVNEAGAFKIIGEDTPPDPGPEPEVESDEPIPDPTPQPMTLDSRIAWNSAINNAVHALGSVWSGQAAGNNSVSSSSYDPSSEYWLKKVNEVALSLYELIRRGPVAPVEAPPEEKDDPDLDVVLDAR